MSNSEMQFLLDKVNKECKPITQAIISLKAQVDFNLSQIENRPTGNSLDKDVAYVKNLVDEIESLLKEIKLKDSNINDFYNENEIDSHHPQYFEELNRQIQYRCSIKLKLFKIKSEILNTTPQKDLNTCTHLGDSIIESIDCGFFEGSETDTFAYKSFITKFKISLDNVNDTLKFYCLKSKLKGYAYSLIQNLTISDGSYNKALEILDKEFLDEKYIVDEIIKKIISLKPVFDPTFNATRVYLNEIRVLIYELESYNLKFLEENAGLLLLSHIVLSKLPNVVVKEITRKLDTNYPDLNQIFDNYNEILRNLVKTSNHYQINNCNIKREIVKPNSTKVAYLNFKQSSVSVRPNYQFKNKTQRFKTTLKSNNRPDSHSFLQNLRTVSEKEASHSADSSTSKFKDYSKLCKFCSSRGHVMTNCNKYENYDSRVKRCLEINLCYRCSSSKHGANQCPGLNEQLSFSCQICRENSHITALCKQKKDTQDFETPSENSNVKKSGKNVMKLECSVCFQTLSGKIGSPDICNHFFCQDCICEWAKTRKTCPLCRKSFCNINLCESKEEKY